uniref:Uncharacterized protein LOC105629849 n=1 Tax=Rhizophora mucronata TaxID=61149 RepID=A0A2P2IPL8_RHIMU
MESVILIPSFRSNSSRLSSESRIVSDTEPSPISETIERRIKVFFNRRSTCDSGT